MSVRKRSWGKNNKESWIVDFTDAANRRRLKTFHTKRDADRFHGVVKAVGAGHIPEPLARGYRPLEFVSKLPLSGWRNGSGREAIAEALRAQHPTIEPTTESVIVHVVAEMQPSSTVADVDNLLKPVLDALQGVVWVNDTQVCELLVRRIPSRHRQLRIKIWHMPGPEVVDHLNALAALDDDARAKRP